MHIEALLRHRFAVIAALATWGVACGPDKLGTTQGEEGEDSGDEAATDGGEEASDTGDDGPDPDMGGEEPNECFPVDHANPEQCETVGCEVPLENQTEWEYGLYFCMEVDDPAACVTCWEQPDCVDQAIQHFEMVSPGTLPYADVYETRCGPAELEGSCCYTVVLGEGAIPGRPFGVEGQAVRTADTVVADPASPASRAQAQGARQPELSAYWRRVAELEHASVASFARFTLQLMALGAPPSLLAQSQQAGLDEIEHARLAYGLAERFGGAAMKAGGLDVAGALTPELMHDPVAILRAALHEGCIAETLAAAMAAVAAQRCEDAETKAALEQIAEDELRHATLAWEVMAWARTAYPEALRQALRDWRRELQPFAKDPDGAPEWGVLGIADETAICERVMASTIRPAVASLLA